jgi:L-alanine-DL-glutamate epimerase-like enolase superfamily enzyme
MKLTVATVTVPMRTTLHSGHGTVSGRELVRVTLGAADGLTGHGEAAPLASYDGVSADEVRAALERCRPVLAQYPGHAPVADVIARCAETTILPQALAAIDLALWDLAGRRAREPVWRLLGAAGGPGGPGPIEVNWTIAAADRGAATLEAAQARAEGYRTLKVKVGLADDAPRVAAIRAFAGPEMAIRVDANGAWDEDEAFVTLAELAPSAIELCEEPVHGLEAIAALRSRTEIPLALDESTEDPAAFAPGAAAVVPLACLKISRCGGITGILAAAARARAAGYEVYLASTFDGPLGIAAALHAAAVIRPARACGLATLGLFDRDPTPLKVRDGALAVPLSPGLGIADPAGWYGA